MKKDFIQRSIKISIVVTIIFAPFLLVYLGYSFSLGFLAGAAWNIVNVYLLSQFIQMLVLSATPNANPDKKWGVSAGVLKFPVLYGVGFAIIQYTNLSVYGIMLGFSLILIIFGLRVLGMLLMNSPDNLWTLRDARKQGTGNYGRGT